MQTLEILIFFFQRKRQRSLEIYRLKNFLTQTQTEFFQLLSMVMYIPLIYTWFEKNAGVDRSSYLYRVNQKLSLTNAFVLYLN